MVEGLIDISTSLLRQGQGHEIDQTHPHIIPAGHATGNKYLGLLGTAVPTTGAAGTGTYWEY